MFGPVVKIAKAKQDKKCITRCLVISLTFLFAGKVNFNGTSFSKWSQLRKVLREEIIRVHKNDIGKIPGIDDPTCASTSDIADALCTLLAEEGLYDDDEVIIEDSGAEARVMEILEDVQTIEDLENALEALCLCF